MKKKILLYSAFLAAACFSYTSCNKVASLVKAASVAWTGVDVTFDVPLVTDVTAQHAIGSGTFTYDLDALIRSQTANQLGLANIDEFHLSSCTVTINNTDATDNNLSNFESADAILSTSANQAPVPIGSVTIPDVAASTIDVPVNTATNLKSYVSPSGTTTFNYVVNAKARRITSKVLNATVHVTYNIHVTP